MRNELRTCGEQREACAFLRRKKQTLSISWHVRSIRRSLSRKPHPPILAGGPEEHKTLRLVAQYVDACNLMGYFDKDAYQRKLDRLCEHC